MDIRATVLIAWAAFASSPVEPLPDLTQFSGTYSGNRILLQSGLCPIDGGVRSSQRTSLVLTVEPDGSFIAGEMPPNRPPGRFKADWRGRIASDLEVTVEARGRATCSGVPREYSIPYEGRLQRKGSRWELRLKGIDPSCPAGACRFRRDYTLIQQ